MDTHFARPSPLFSIHTRLPALCLLFLAALLLPGCAGNGGVGKVVNRTLESVGLREADADAKAGITTLPLRLYAGDNLNAGNDDRGLATVVRIYHLRGVQRFEQAPFDALMDESRERSELGNDLIEVRELVLTPGIRRELEERLPADATHVGVVALFRSPASGRWRYAFDARHREARDQGITIGLHACAMTTSSGALTTPLPGDPASLVSARCAR